MDLKTHPGAHSCVYVCVVCAPSLTRLISLTTRVFMYLFAEGYAILAVQDSAVDIQRGQFPQFSLIIAGAVENRPAGYVAQRGSCRVMVMTPCLATQLPGCRQEPAALPVNTNVYTYMSTVRRTDVYVCTPRRRTQHSDDGVNAQIHVSSAYITHNEPAQHQYGA